MTDPFEFWVPGRPKAKARPRLGRGRRAFTPQTTIDEEHRIASLYREQGGPFFETSVALIVDYYPEGQLIRIEERDWTTSLNADVDNLVKLTGDALQRREGKNGAVLSTPGSFAFADDRHVVEVHSAKWPRGMAPF